MTKSPTWLLANWKMHGTAPQLRDWVTAVAAASTGDNNVQTALCPPFPLLTAAKSLLADDVWLGGQNLHTNTEGAFTGEVSANMLCEAGCRLVLVGHSERRQYQHETNEEIAAKAATAQQHGLIPVICLGETASERTAGQTEAVLERQLDAVLGCFHVGEPAPMIAYEPVWAIGTGCAASSSEIETAHRFIRQHLPEPEQTSVLYGGSVNRDNLNELLALPQVNGALVGSASLPPAHFADLIKIARARN